MHVADLSLWAMLAGCFLSTGFLLWFLAGLVMEGNRGSVRALGREHAARTEHNLETFRFRLDHIVASPLRRNQGHL